MNDGVKQVSGLLVFMSPQGNFYNSKAETRHFKAESQHIAIFLGSQYGKTSCGVFKEGILYNKKGTYLLMILAGNNLESSHHAPATRGIHEARNNFFRMDF